MPTFRCDFDITGDLVLPNDVSQLDLASGGFVLTFKNAPPDEEGHAPGLVVNVVGPAESFDIAYEKLRAVLAAQLDLLSFTTHSRFRISAPRRLIEWDEGQKQRLFESFHTRDERYPPEPELFGSFLDTVKTLEEAKPPDFARTSLRYFRYGLLDEEPDDQFMRLWLALEIIAENTKEHDRVPVLCQQCRAGLTCQICGAEQTRVPMAKQAIENLVRSLIGEEPTLWKRLFQTRNGLMHGKSVASIEADGKVPMRQIVDELGVITWKAILASIPLGPPVPEESALTFGHRDGQFANLSLVARFRGIFRYDGDGLHPEDDKIPNPKVTLLTTFRPPG